MFPIDQIAKQLEKPGDSPATAQRAALVIVIILVAIVVVMVMKYMSKDKGTYVVGSHRNLVGHGVGHVMGNNHSQALRYTKHAGLGGTMDDTHTRATDSSVPGGGYNVITGHHYDGSQDRDRSEYYDESRIDGGLDDYSKLNCSGTWDATALAEAAALEEVMGQSATGAVGQGQAGGGKSDSYYAEAMRGRM